MINGKKKIKLRKKLVKTLKINKLFDLTGKIEIGGKTRQNAEKTKLLLYDEKLKIEIERKTRQNAESKQTFGLKEKTKFFYAKNLISR